MAPPSMDRGGFSEWPRDAGLYSSALEKDACGVGFIANFKSQQSHKLVHDALVMLDRMEHRGGCGCEENTGDGAGIMIGLPVDFCARVVKESFGRDLPAYGSWAVGNVFCSRNADVRNYWKKKIESILETRAIKLIGWRKCPVDPSGIGRSALRTEPFVEQLYVEKTKDYGAKRFDLELFVVCQMLRSAAIEEDAEDQIYICSLSSQTMVYKGQLTSPQVPQYYLDLQRGDFASHFALVHSRFSTNTFPSWDRAHPNRVLCHNGEINTLRGNKNLMRSREGLMLSPLLDPQDAKLVLPICSEEMSDSGNFDMCLNLLSKASDRTLPEAVMMMLPEAWQHDARLSDEKRAFYEYNSCLMEPWDGPAMIAFADGRYLGCILDRNGLRPNRYYVTDEIVVAASEVGVIPDIPHEAVIEKGRLQPGKIFLVDFEREGIVRDEELKQKISTRRPYGQWLQDNLLHLRTVPASTNRALAPIDKDANGTVLKNNRLNMFGFSVETIDLLLPPMVNNKKEALGSMGVDTPLACLSQESRSMFDYFKQLFAQVTNPPMDSIREAVVMAMECPIGPERNLLDITAEHARRLVVDHPVLSPREAQALLELSTLGWKTVEIDCTYPRSRGGAPALEAALQRICEQSSAAIQDGASAIFLTDRQAGPARLPIPSLIAAGAVHQHLLRTRERTRAALVVEGGDCREVHHFCCLVGFGADAVYPYMAYEALLYAQACNKIPSQYDFDQIVNNYIVSCGKGIRKVMGKIGISTIQSYKGAQIFEAVGIGPELMEMCFKGTASRIGGITLETVHADVGRLHEVAWPRTVPDGLPTKSLLNNPGEFHFRNGGESHYNDPMVIEGIQTAARTGERAKYDAYAKHANEQAAKCTLRGLLEFKQGPSGPIPIEEVEPAKEIVKRFCSGAMSYGSISLEAHETLAIAMNRINAKSNTGEGGENSDRFTWVGENGDSKRSAIKQVASGRFGVTSNYLANSDEVQIKMAQGAKPGEGGELPGHKVAGQIAVIRNSTEGVGLISPPPHHDIYSIEDLAQLIHDLKNANPTGRVSVKLVSEVGVGVIASGVAKAKADHIVVSGHDGGTGAAAWTGVKHAGLPWELGIAETQQTLVLNNLRGRVVLQTDGQMKTGRDVAVAFLLGAEEVAFATAPLIALGCIMMRKCHLNTCPVGIATQDPELRKLFFGKPEYVVNFLFLVAEEVRTYMAHMGFRTVKEMVGRADMLEPKKNLSHSKLTTMDLSNILLNSSQLARASPYSLVPSNEVVHLSNVQSQDHGLEKALDQMLIQQSQPALQLKERVKIVAAVGNVNRTVGTMLSNLVSKKYGDQGLPDNTINITLSGSAGQSLGAFLAPGVHINCIGDTNDYCGKGLSGGSIAVYPHPDFRPPADTQQITGNVCFYGATRGEGYIAGIAGERFCVRNSGAMVVVEGVGDHGCEYMTGGRVTILGETGRNFGAGMSGGIAFVYDKHSTLENLCNFELISLVDLEPEDFETLKEDIQKHAFLTSSAKARNILNNWEAESRHFIKVYPNDLRRVIESNVDNPQFQLPVWFPQSKAARQQMPHVSQRSMQDRHIVPTPLSSKVKTIGSVSDIEDISSSSCSGGNKEEDEAKLKMNKTAGTGVSNYQDYIVTRRDGSTGPINKLRGFIEYERDPEPYRPAMERILDYEEINQPVEARDDLERKRQAARCMDCGTPFCQTHTGCPINNLIPEFNELVFQDHWRQALDRLLKTNNFPEFTGRVCPAPCEGACVAGLIDEPVTIKNMEYAIIDRGFREGWIVPSPPKVRSGKTVAVVGSGPAGLACADELNKMGHTVTVLERADRIGGLLMYGIPNMKLDKKTVQRRVDLMAAEGIKFVTGANVGVDPEFDVNRMAAENDAVVLCVGATKPRDLPIPGRKLNGVHFAMDFLTKNTKTLLDDGNGRLRKWDGSYIDAKDKDVVVIGGGDTGCDCIGTSVRHGCRSLVNLELLPQPPDTRATGNEWPQWPKIMRVDYGHGEVAAKFGKDPRQYGVLTEEFLGDSAGNVVGLRTVLVEWVAKPGGGFTMNKVPNTEKTIAADLVLLSMGFLGPEPEIVDSLKLDVDDKSNIKAPYGRYNTSSEGIFACGDCRRGQSLVVWAINEGRGAAQACSEYISSRNVASL